MGGGAFPIRAAALTRRLRQCLPRRLRRAEDNIYRKKNLRLRLKKCTTKYKQQPQTQTHFLTLGRPGLGVISVVDSRTVPQMVDVAAAKQSIHAVVGSKRAAAACLRFQKLRDAKSNRLFNRKQASTEDLPRSHTHAIENTQCPLKDRQHSAGQVIRWSPGGIHRRACRSDRLSWILKDNQRPFFHSSLILNCLLM